MDRIKRYGLGLVGVLLLSGALLVGTLVGPAAAQTGPGGSPAPNGAGMMGGATTGTATGMMGGTATGTGTSMMGGTATGMMGGAATSTGTGMMGDVDRHFIEMMIPHHEAAVAMADLALQNAQHPELKDLATAIKQTQTAEIAQMRTWYRQWYGVDVPTTANGTGCGMMGGAGMMGGVGMMGGAGMMGDQDAMDSDLSALTNAANFDQAFIQQMVPHHQMALMMAQMVLAHGQQPELKNLAQAIITGQSAEIAQMQSWYQQWYGAPTP